MNRPVVKDYWDENNNFRWDKYTEHLEKYCDEAYEKGRSDKYQEITTEYLLLTEKQVADIREDVIEECLSDLSYYYNLYIDKMEQLKERKK